MYVAFMDLEKAYNTVCREEMWRVQHVCGIDGYLIRSVSNLYDGSRACVRFGGRTWEYFEIRRELK